MNKKADNRPAAPVVFLGVQEGFGDLAPVALFNVAAKSNVFSIFQSRSLTAGSTVTQRTIESAGFCVPEVELAKAKHALLNFMSQIRCIYKKEAA